MPTTKFLTDRKRGEPAQKYVAGMLRSWGLTVRETPRGYLPGFDMTMQGKLHGYDINTTVEVKYDYLAIETGRIYLDINSLGRSQAGILAICTGKPIDTIYLLPRQDALSYAQTCPYKVRGGEYGEQGANPPIPVFIQALKPKVLTTKQ